MRSVVTFVAALVVVTCAQLENRAAAQRTEENALKSAQDAFGTTVGTETIGLYSVSSARGFSPVRAGNLRLEGLYFDTRGGGGGMVRLSSRLLAQNTIRVGLSAQSYPFPAPTGIADYSIRLPGEKLAVSSVFRAVYPESEAVELDAQIPLTEKFSLGVGFGAEHTTNDFAVTYYSLDGALIGRWTISDSVELIPFYSRTRQFDNVWGPFLFAAGRDLPPEYDRDMSLTQDWAFLNNEDVNYGAIVKSNWSDWTLSAGLFRSVSSRLGGDSAQVHYRNIQPNGDAEIWIVRMAGEGHPNTSASGEIRLARPFAEGPRRHTIYFNARGKQVENGYGGNVTRRLGSGSILTQVELPEPTFAAGPRGREYVRQYSAGISYQLLWQDVGELSAGLQRTRYTRYTRFIDPTPSSTTYEWLYNGTVAAYLSDRFVVYAGYTRGLEDAPRAPPFAVNSGASASATLTQQVDGGFRFTLMPGLTLVGGAFQVKKPFFELDKNGFFGRLGDVTHRGVEVSLSGTPLPDLTVVAGVIGLEPRLSGPLVDNGTLGTKPPETVPVTALFSAQYGPASWRGFSIDTRVNFADAYPADVLNTFKSPAVTTLDLGMRYRFKFGTTPALIRAQLQNVFDAWKWNFQGTQLQIRPIPERKITLQLTLDY